MACNERDYGMRTDHRIVECERDGLFFEELACLVQGMQNGNEESALDARPRRMLLERISHFTRDDLHDVALNDEGERVGFEFDLLIARVEMEIVDGDDGAHDGR